MTRDELIEALDYDSLNGCFYWRASRGRARIGDLAGSDNGVGYKCVRLNGKSWRVHVLVWLMETGLLPERQIDHKDTNRSNNVFSNLRLSSQLENTYNRSAMSNNKSGVKGVHWHASSGKWRAVITVAGRKITIGRFDTLEEAKQEIEARRLIEHKEFARQ